MFILIALFIVSILAGPYEIPIVHGATDYANALFAPETPSNDLPESVGITLGGATASFHKNTVGYNEMIRLLRRRNTLELTDEEPLDLPVAHSCGEMVVYRWGIPIHFPLYHSTANPHCYWIRVPNLTGYEYPGFADDGKLVSLIHETSNLSTANQRFERTPSLPLPLPIYHPRFYGK